MSYQSASPMSTPRIRPSSGELADAAAEGRITGRARSIDRREQRRGAHEHPGVECVVLLQRLADRHDRSPDRRTLVASAATSGVAGRESTASSDSSALRRFRQQPCEHRRLEHVVAHQQRESAVGEPGACGQDRHPVLEMPLKIVGEMHVETDR